MQTNALRCVKRCSLAFLLTCTLWTVSPSVSAQCEAQNDAFQSGEHVMYDLYFNWSFIWTKVGIASLTTNGMHYAGKPAYRLNLLALSSKRADSFFKMRDTLTCIIGDKMQPYYFRKGAEEGKRYTVDEVHFSYKNGSCMVKQKRINHLNEVSFLNTKEERCVYDMLSILAQARSFNAESYAVGERIKFPMATGSSIEEQTLIYRGKKTFEAEDKKTYRTLVFSLVENKKGKERDIITFYITDDKNHIPVRLDMNLNFGSAKAFLRSIKNNKHPMTSIVKE